MRRALLLIAGALTLVGALNWGLVGLFRFNLVHALFRPVERVIYTLVGISSLVFGLTLAQGGGQDIEKMRRM